MRAFVTRAGDFIGFNPHAHILVTDGCFYGNKGMFLVAPPWPGMAGHPVFSHTEQGKADGAVIRILQHSQRLRSFLYYTNRRPR